MFFIFSMALTDLSGEHLSLMVCLLVTMASVLVTTAEWTTSLSPGLCQIVVVSMRGVVRRGSFLVECTVRISLGGMGCLFGV